MIPQRIVAIGASSCEGQYDPQHGGYVGLLYQWHEGENQRHHVYNLGISADTSSGIAQRLLSECQLRRPHLIICQVGANDTLHEGSADNPATTPQDVFEQNIRSIIESGKSLADVIFISIYPIDETKTLPVFWGEFYYRLEDVKKYADKTKQVCEELGIPYIDIFNEWMSTDYKKYLHTDGLHANAEGHKYIFEKVKSALVELYPSE